MVSFLRAVAAFVSFTANAIADLSTDASGFLASVGLAWHPLVDEVREASVGSGWRFDSSEDRIQAVQLQLEGTFRAMPKNADGKLDLMTARYAMHRYFVQSNGWFVHGVDPAGASFNASSPVDVLIGGVPDSVHAVFARRLAETGFDLADLATLAVTVESVIQRASASKLQQVYQGWHKSTAENSTVTTAEADKLMASYQACHILNKSPSSVTTRELLLQMTEIKQIYPAWPLVLQHMRSVRERHHSDSSVGMSFGEVEAVLHEVERTWNRAVNNEQCGILKGHLLDLNDRGTGCVKLSSFYDAMLHKDIWQFSESPQYLRESGILDESDPTGPKLIMANYINSPGNCVSNMGLFSICCLSECEDRLAYFERHLQAPQATPQALASVAVSMPSDYAPTNYSLPQHLLHKLEAIAQNGKVSLHGRLFAQWLHHAYPRQCPFPHMAGHTAHHGPWSYEASTGKQLLVSDDEAYSLSETARSPVTDSANGTCAPWEDEEELFVNPAHAHHQAFLESEAAVWRGMYCVAALTGSMAVALLLLQTSRTMMRTIRGVKGEGGKQRRLAPHGRCPKETIVV